MDLTSTHHCSKFQICIQTVEYNFWYTNLCIQWPYFYVYHSANSLFGYSCQNQHLNVINRDMIYLVSLEHLEIQIPQTLGKNFSIAELEARKGRKSFTKGKRFGNWWLPSHWHHFKSLYKAASIHKYLEVHAPWILAIESKRTSDFLVEMRKCKIFFHDYLWYTVLVGTPQ